MQQTHTDLNHLREIIVRHWGFRSFRPLQELAMEAALAGRDSVVVMPTGGGKSLCYQAPAIARGDTTIVVSPLISLMKDQVDGLQSAGIPAIQLNSSQTAAQQRAHEEAILAGEYRLVFVAPERLLTPAFQQLLRQIDVKSFAIDEAHCISHWGHDFRPEYRNLHLLREAFPSASLHAFTATATQQVRQDIVKQLSLRDPLVLVGDFDRPNLTYRVLPRDDLLAQVQDVLDRHKDEAGIIYCIRRKDVDGLVDDLKLMGIDALPYHAGKPPEERKHVQEAFAREECNLVVATIAFGMGIDRSNIRFVLHIAMPKSVEHYQQETGRAGRDGLEAECTLLHSGADPATWKWIINKTGENGDIDPSFVPTAKKHVDDMDRYCRDMTCRHKALVGYFGQKYSRPSCEACDVCLGDKETMSDGLIIAQKILSCVARVQERFGVSYVTKVLRGQNDGKIRERGHESLSTFGLMSEYSAGEIREWIYQLIGQEVLIQTGSEYPTLQLNEASWAVMKGEQGIKLFRPVRSEKRRASRAEEALWQGVHRGLFDALRAFRRRMAEERGVPPYVIFGDATLRDMAKVRPSNLGHMRPLYGVGDKKLTDFGSAFRDEIVSYCHQNGLPLDQPLNSPRRASSSDASSRSRHTRSENIEKAFSLFQEKCVIEDVMHQIGRSRSTTTDYLCKFIREERPDDVSMWIADEIIIQVKNAAKIEGSGRLKPIYLALNEQVSYDEIRIALAVSLPES